MNRHLLTCLSVFVSVMVGLNSCQTYKVDNRRLGIKSQIQRSIKLGNSSTKFSDLGELLTDLSILGFSKFDNSTFPFDHFKIKKTIGVQTYRGEFSDGDRRFFIFADIESVEKIVRFSCLPLMQ